MKPRLGTNRSLTSNPHFPKRNTKLFVIAVEGEATENLYFKKCIGQRNSRVSIEVLPTKEHKTSPENVLKRLRKRYDEDFIVNQTRKQNDEFWLVVDVDDWKNLPEVLNQTENAGFQHAVSNPNFEVWLALYSPKFQNTPKERQRLKTKPESIIEEHINTAYQKSRLNPTHYKDHETAIKNALALDRNSNAQIPEAPGTRVYKLVQAILDFGD